MPILIVTARPGIKALESSCYFLFDPRCFQRWIEIAFPFLRCLGKEKFGSIDGVNAEGCNEPSVTRRQEEGFSEILPIRIGVQKNRFSGLRNM